jgi:hypothetical protein
MKIKALVREVLNHDTIGDALTRNESVAKVPSWKASVSLLHGMSAKQLSLRRASGG